jgi:hypothetical protein
LFFCHGQISFLESELHSFFTLSFDDINEVDDFLGHLPPNLPVHAPGTNPVSLLIRHYSTGKDNKSWDRILGGPKPKLFRPVDFAGGDVWRTLTIEVNGDRVCGYWGNERMPTGEILLGRASDRAERDLEKYQAFRDVNPVPKGIAWFPVGGSIGFYVCRGSASFRRTMIEPLIEGTGD